MTQPQATTRQPTAALASRLCETTFRDEFLEIRTGKSWHARVLVFIRLASRLVPPFPQPGLAFASSVERKPGRGTPTVKKFRQCISQRCGASLRRLLVKYGLSLGVSWAG